MNVLSNEDRIRVVSALFEGHSINAASRMTGCARNTIAKLLVDLGSACMQFHDRYVRNVRVRRVLCKEVSANVGAQVRKQAQVWGDIHTWVGIDTDTKLVISYLTGGGGADWATDFIKLCATRIKGRVQVVINGQCVYLETVESAFGIDIDYAQLQEHYGASLETGTFHSPREKSKYPATQSPNTSTQTHLSRFKRMSVGFSKKLDDHSSAIAAHIMYYNFIRIDSALGTTPAVKSGLSDHIWDFAELVGILDLMSS